MSIALDDSLERREWVYCVRPKGFEVYGCPMCGNTDPDWSEFRRYLWCPACRIDFRPECFGVLDGPVGVEVCELMGFYFDKYNVETGEISPGPSGVLHFVAGGSEMASDE